MLLEFVNTNALPFVAAMYSKIESRLLLLVYSQPNSNSILIWRCAKSSQRPKFVGWSMFYSKYVLAYCQIRLYHCGGEQHGNDGVVDQDRLQK